MNPQKQHTIPTFPFSLRRSHLEILRIQCTDRFQKQIYMAIGSDCVTIQ